jgi:D-alanyl-D-alanine carboxypeptidase
MRQPRNLARRLGDWNVRRTRRAALAVLALLNVITLAAGIAVARMMPPRLAALRIPVAADGPVVRAGAVLPSISHSDATPTATGLARLVAADLPPGVPGYPVRVAIADASTGKLLYSDDGDSLATPASTTKLVTATAALAVLGPDARFTTSVKEMPGGIVLVGGGDPVLAVHPYPKSDYPQPATLSALAASTARALKAKGRTRVSLGYDTSLYGGPGLAPGWPESYVSTGNVTPIVSLEVDQGRLTASGAPEDYDDPVNYRARSTNPAGVAAAAFATLLENDGITVTGRRHEVTAAKTAATVASVSSPPLYAIVEQMLQESNNVIAENLGRHVALALGKPATFAGAAGAVETELRRLHVTTPISLVDTSGLSPQDGIAPETLLRVLEIDAGTKDPGGARGAANVGGALAASLRDVITGLPVAGFAGTLSPGGSDFGGIGGAARGVVRAKTGNLSEVATLAGLVTDKNGDLLAFVFMEQNAPEGLQAGANAIDAAAAGLAACGCG